MAQSAQRRTGRPVLDTRREQKSYFSRLGRTQLSRTMCIGGGGGYSDRSAKLITHFNIVPRLRMVEIYIHSPTFIHDVMLN
jgi:hypothetical protein